MGAEKGDTVNINTVAAIVTKREGLKKSMTIAQVKEVLKIVNSVTSGELYKLLRKV